MRWFMDLFYPVLEWSRHRKATEIATEPPGAGDFSGLRGTRQALIVSYKRSGEPVPTVVNCALSDEGKLYFRTEPQTAKVKRIENGPRVLVGPCNLRGKPSGELAAGRARVLSEAESEVAYELIRSNWSAAVRPGELAMDGLGVDVVYIEAQADSAGTREV